MPLDAQALAQTPELALRQEIEVFVRDSPANRLEHLDGSPIYEAPLVGYAHGGDPLFEEYKTIIGPFHLTPREAIQYAIEEGPLAQHSSTKRLSVICWALPISEATRASNRPQKAEPSQRWAHTRTYGEEFNDMLRRHVVEVLRAAGYLAIAPMLSPGFKTINEGVARPPVSTWSERHALYAAGLGTFSLSDGFITPRGIAMRCGSVVTNLPLQPTPRTAENHMANCLFYAEGTCGKCIERCPAGAITREGHDKSKCQEYVYHTLMPLAKPYNAKTVGCGLCQTGVPCEAMVPPRSKH
jgi:epoxyqueuosine reductase